MTTYNVKKGKGKLVLLLILSLSVCIVSNRGMGKWRAKETAASSVGDFFGTVVLSGFRPLAVDILWIRANDLFRQRQYYQLLSLYELIAALEPHFESAWVFNASNLAFSLSSLESTDRAQWEWVRRGLLFAQEGYTKNPSSDQICFAIAWIYYFRVPQNPEFVKFLQSDLELNPDRTDYLQLALKWAERGYAVEPHTLFLDYLLELVYRRLAEEAKETRLKLHYQEKRLALWNRFLLQTPDSERAKEKVGELEAAIRELKKSMENENR